MGDWQTLTLAKYRIYKCLIDEHNYIRKKRLLINRLLHLKCPINEQIRLNTNTYSLCSLVYHAILDTIDLVVKYTVRKY